MGRLLELAPSTDLRPAALPPQEVWLPLTEKIETPVDALGRVDRFRLVELVRATVEPEFDWPIDEGNNHHLYWPDAWFPYAPDDGELRNPSVFRNRCNHMVRLPIMFHNWVHRVTVPPSLPSEEVRMHMTEASILAERTLAALTITINHERNSRKILRKIAKMSDKERAIYLHTGKRPTSERGIEEVAAKSEEAFQAALAQMQAVPREFQLVNPSLSRLGLRRELGRVVGMKQNAGALPMFNEVVQKVATLSESSNAQKSLVA